MESIYDNPRKKKKTLENSNPYIKIDHNNFDKSKTMFLPFTLSVVIPLTAAF